MFNCGKCPAVFIRKYNLVRHKKTHDAVRLSCPSCILAFSDKSNLSRHMKIKHGMYRTFDILYIFFFFKLIYLVSLLLLFFLLFFRFCLCTYSSS